MRRSSWFCPKLATRSRSAYDTRIELTSAAWPTVGATSAVATTSAARAGKVFTIVRLPFCDAGCWGNVANQARLETSRLRHGEDSRRRLPMTGRVIEVARCSTILNSIVGDPTKAVRQPVNRRKVVSWRSTRGRALALPIDDAGERDVVRHIADG